MDELDEGELFTVCLDDDGQPVLRTATDMTAGEVTAAIDHLTANPAGDSALMVPAAGRLSVRYRELTMPVAIMAGRRDKIVHIEPHPMRLHGLVRQSTLDVIDRGGHMLHHAHPEKIVAKVESLWAEMRPASDPEAAMPYSANAKPSSTSA